MILLKEALKAWVAACQKAIEEAAKAVAEALRNAAVNAAAEAALEELGGPGEPVVIESDEGESESHDEGTYAAFEEVIGVEDHEASYIEALWFRVDLVRSSFLTFFLTFCQDLLFIVYIWSGAILESWSSTASSAYRVDLEVKSTPL